MGETTVHIVRTGTANLASVVAALARAGMRSELTDSASAVREARALVLPGVGSFGAAMAALDQAGVSDALRARFEAGKPMLAICLGMQVLFEASEESPGVRGLGLVGGSITRFAGDVRVPQLGWNRVEVDRGCSLLSEGDAYYANSFRAAALPAGFLGGWSVHGARFLAAMERGAILACQFHPELSGAWGARVISRWLERAGLAPSPQNSTSARESAAC